MRSIAFAAVLSLAAALPAGAQELLPLAQVKPGMTGYGLTVFEGARIEKFGVRVLAILKNAFPKQDLILARAYRLDDKGFDLERTGIIGGMSGSPIYLEGKLAGALAYGWSFARDPVFGITPIQNMLDELRRPLERTARLEPRAAPEGLLRPCLTPLAVAGATPRTVERLRALFEPYSMVPVLGGGGGGGGQKAGGDPRAALQPGAPLAVQLVDGDLDLSAVGTVTMVQGDQVVAFGHPFLNAGEVDLPVATAQVDGVISTLLSSFKLATPLQAAGRLTKDRQAAVVARLGPAPRLLPLAVTVKNKKTGAQTRFACRLFEHPLLTPRLANIALSNFLEVSEPSFGRHTTHLRLEVALAGRPPLVFRDVIAGRGDTFSSAMTDVFRALWNNPWKPVAVERIGIELEVEHQDREARIARVAWSEDEVEPGETVRLSVVLQRKDAPDEVVPVAFRLPADLPPGPHVLTVTGGDNYQPAVPAPDGVDALVRWVGALERGDALVVWMPLPRLVLQHQGRELRGLPRSVTAALLPANRGGDLGAAQEVHHVATPTPWVIAGQRQVQIVVKERKPR